MLRIELSDEQTITPSDFENFDQILTAHSDPLKSHLFKILLICIL